MLDRVPDMYCHIKILIGYNKKILVLCECMMCVYVSAVYLIRVHRWYVFWALSCLGILLSSNMKEIWFSIQFLRFKLLGQYLLTIIPLPFGILSYMSKNSKLFPFCPEFIGLNPHLFLKFKSFTNTYIDNVLTWLILGRAQWFPFIYVLGPNFTEHNFPLFYSYLFFSHICNSWFKFLFFSFISTIPLSLVISICYTVLFNNNIIKIIDNVVEKVQKTKILKKREHPHICHHKYDE